MTPIKLAGFFVLTTLSFQNIEGKNPLLLDATKDVDLKLPEKRGRNFRINVETPFDPNFWPSRGRRGRRDPEKGNDDCIATDDYLGFQCHRETRVKKSDSDIGPTNPDSGLFDRGRMGSDCYGTDAVKRKFGSDATYVKVSHGLDQFMTTNRRRRQRILPLSRFFTYGNGLYYEPDNTFGEKMKKQDVFWVVRGKKNFD